MGKKSIATLGALLFLAPFIILSCASMQMRDLWRDSTFQGPAYRKVMVVALTKRADLRQPLEDEFRRQLAPWGVEAVPSHEHLPDVDRISRPELARVGAPHLAARREHVHPFTFDRVPGIRAQLRQF